MIFQEGDGVSSRCNSRAWIVSHTILGIAEMAALAKAAEVSGCHREREKKGKTVVRQRQTELK
jgi:hypothetical protein